MSNLLAVDPGLSGGIAIQRDREPAIAYAMPDTEGDLVQLLRELVPNPATTVAVVEQVGGYVGKTQPASGAFKFGRNFGFLLGTLQTLGVRVELVQPAKWQKNLSLGTATGCGSKTIWKNKLKACAQRLYPNLRVTLATADALLILEYARRTAATLPRPAPRMVCERSPTVS